MLPPDYHMHTPLCRHAVGEPTEYAARAVELGMTEIGFSDHSPMQRDDFDDWRMALRDLDTYVAGVRMAQDRFSKLQIRLALEVDYLPGHEAWIQDLAGRYDWDYFIGSVHYIDDWALDSPYELDRWAAQDVASVWARYFDLLAKAASSRLFQIIAHPDLCKKFGHRPSGDCSPMYRSFLQEAFSTGVAVELNTAGLRKPCNEIYPSRSFLEIASQLHVPITFGSDAHAPNEVAMNFAEAVREALAAGYTRYAAFKQRKMEFRPLKAE